MALQLKKRHGLKCREANGIKEWDHSVTRCRCPYLAEGTLKLDGYVRVSTKEPALEKARALVQRWEEAGTVYVSGPEPPPAEDPNRGHTPVDEAIAEFNSGYLDAKHVKPGTKKLYGVALRSLARYAEDRGLRFIDELNLGELQRWQKTWGLAARSACKRHEHARTFFKFAQDREWVTANPTDKMHVSRPATNQKEPFSEEEIDATMAAARQYSRGAASSAPRVYAATLTLLYSGMRLIDLCHLRASDLDARDRLSYFPTKTNQEGAQQRMVTVKLPGFVAQELRALAPVRGDYWFSTAGESEHHHSLTETWRAKFALVWPDAEKLLGRPFSSKPTPHRFRHTFAIRLLLRGVSIDDVADLLGHSDPKITRKHYRRWIPGLQDRLDDIVDQAWSEQRKPRLVSKKRA